MKAEDFKKFDIRARIRIELLNHHLRLRECKWHEWRKKKVLERDIGYIMSIYNIEILDYL